MTQQFEFTPEKLDLLAEKADPKVFFSLMEQYKAENPTGGTLMGSATPSNEYGSILAPKGGAAQPGPILTPQMLQMLGPKSPQVLPPAGIPQNAQMGPMAQYQGAPTQPGYSQFLRRG